MSYKLKGEMCYRRTIKRVVKFYRFHTCVSQGKKEYLLLFYDYFLILIN